MFELKISEFLKNSQRNSQKISNEIPKEFPTKFPTKFPKNSKETYKKYMDIPIKIRSINHNFNSTQLLWLSWFPAKNTTWAKIYNTVYKKPALENFTTW